MAKEHWAEAGGGARARAFRASALNRVLGHYGLSVHAWAAGAYVLREQKGGSAVVSDLGALWVEAEKLTGAALDPLDPGLVVALER